MRLAATLVLLLAVAAAACGPRRVALPADAGVPLPGFEQIHAQLTAACTGVRTITAVLGLSGRAGEQPLRGRVAAGFERPDSMRLEAVALGQLVFVMAARGGSATVLFPRERRVLLAASPDAVLGALTGVALAPSELQSILTGCVLAAPRAVAGRLHGNGWASIDVTSSGSSAAMATMYLEPRQGQWRLVAARRAGWRVDYPEWQATFPATVRLQSLDPGVPVEMTADISEMVTNDEIDPAAFAVDVPADAAALTLDELRQSGPLRGN